MKKTSSKASSPKPDGVGQRRRWQAIQTLGVLERDFQSLFRLWTRQSLWCILDRGESPHRKRWPPQAARLQSGKVLSARLRPLYPRRFQGKSQYVRNPNAKQSSPASRACAPFPPRRKQRPQRVGASTALRRSLAFSHGHMCSERHNVLRSEIRKGKRNGLTHSRSWEKAPPKVAGFFTVPSWSKVVRGLGSGHWLC